MAVSVSPGPVQAGVGSAQPFVASFVVPLVVPFVVPFVAVGAEGRRVGFQGPLVRERDGLGCGVDVDDRVGFEGRECRRCGFGLGLGLGRRLVGAPTDRRELGDRLHHVLDRSLDRGVGDVGSSSSGVNPSRSKVPVS